MATALIQPAHNAIMEYCALWLGAPLFHTYQFVTYMLDVYKRQVYDLLQAFSTPVSLADQRREKIAAVMARGGAKGIPRNMSSDEAAALLAQLAATGNFSFSPSGKAITAEITPADIRTKLG